MASRAFTLLELLVAIAIVAIVAALVMGVAASARAEAEAARCLSNLRQWGGALNLYANDNDGLLPRRGQGVQPVTQVDRPTDWFNALPPYLQMPAYSALAKQGQRLRASDTSVLVCPVAKDGGARHFSRTR